MHQLRLQDIEDAASPWLEDVARLYRASFPVSERKPIDILGQAACRSDYRLLAAFHDESLVGMAVVYLSPAFALLEYMAVSPTDRGTGIGSALLAGVQAPLVVPLLLEVESVREGAPGAALRRRRIDFYRRHGCRPIADFTYYMPRLSAEVPPPLMLMVHGWPSDTLPGAVLRSWLGEIYAQVYRQPPDHPLLAQMRQAVPERVHLA